MRPQRAGRVFEQLGFELLPAEPGAFVFANDLIEKCRRQVGAIFVARAAGHDTDRVTYQIADQLQNVLLNCITGHYHRPRPQQRVFLFIDIEGSTTLAERLGDLAFHRLVDRFVIDLSGAEVPRPVAGRP